MDGTFYVYSEANLHRGQLTGPMTWQRPYEKSKGELYNRRDLCDAHALSVFADLEDVNEARRLTPWIRRKSVAAVTVAASDGRLKNTPTDGGRSHHDWWTNPVDLIPSATVILEGAA